MKDIIEALREFNQAREWGQFHSPGNLAKSICIEAAELLADFQWSDPTSRSGYKKRAEEEIADIMIYALIFCDRMGIDPQEAIRSKIKLNGIKYPVEKSRGRAKKYDTL